jgi:hypothetical protein
MLTICLAAPHEAMSFYQKAQKCHGHSVIVTGLRNHSLEKILPTVTGKYVIAGFSGTLTDLLKPGDLTLVERVAAANSAPLIPDFDVRSALNHPTLPLINSSLYTSDHMIDTFDEKKKLSRLGFDAVDMESYHLAAYIRARGGTFGILRIISDRADEKAQRDYTANIKTFSDKLSRVLTMISSNSVD